ncbi:terpene synthase family protein [Streptomyces acidiscabies]|uniref:Terpene synthase family protein n=1 Tax=Streptomyces acidiscabies TaxID=42234 RepID=A0ABU4ME15_9ACTN|nr:terpene synthase family protein [Streptomyces acidiscabies]MDX3024938.1 terpene synthase family protein [Streptomyces acidiscabies]
MNDTGPFLPGFAATFPGPFPASPHAAHVEQRLVRWAGRHALLEPAAALNSLCHITARGIAHTLPAADPDTLTLSGELMVWLVAFDDACAEANAASDPVRLADHVGELTRVLSGDATQPPAGAYACGLQDLLARFRDRATPTQYLRLTGNLRDNLTGLLWEAHHLPAPQHVTVHTYRAMRPYTVFIRTLTSAVQIALSYELTQQQQSCAQVRELETAAANVAGWVNDLASYPREARTLPAAPLSLPTLLMAEHRLDLPRAFAMAASMCEEQAAITRARIDDLSRNGPPPVALHAQATEHIVNSYVWHISHHRYVTPNGPAVHLTSATGSSPCP